MSSLNKIERAILCIHEHEYMNGDAFFAGFDLEKTSVKVTPDLFKSTFFEKMDSRIEEVKEKVKEYMDEHDIGYKRIRERKIRVQLKD